MRGVLLILLAVAASGCLMHPYSGGAAPENQTNASAAQATPPPAQKTCLGPVCGADGQTYDTDCEAMNARTAILYTGECQPPEPACNDTDAGLNTTFAGAAVKGNETDADYCLDSAQLVEYDCLDNTITKTVVQCGAHSECVDGACTAENESAQDLGAEPGCNGTSEPDIYSRGTVTWNGTSYSDLCVDYHNVKDYFCQDGKLESINNNCPGGYACSGGMCAPLVLTCTATAPANDTTVRGRTTVSRGLGTVSEDIDDCVDLQTIRKYYCLQNGSDTYEEFSCGSGKKCVDGRCVRSTCTETDGGRDIYRAGTTTVQGHSSMDVCTDDHTVHEYYCYGDGVLDEEIGCGTGYLCDNGACIQS